MTTIHIHIYFYSYRVIEVKAMFVVNSLPSRTKVRNERVETRYGVVFHTQVENAFMIIYLVINVIIVIIIVNIIIINISSSSFLLPSQDR